MESGTSYRNTDTALQKKTGTSITLVHHCVSVSEGPGFGDSGTSLMGEGRRRMCKSMNGV
jgi:hypothetical protein